MKYLLITFSLILQGCATIKDLRNACVKGVDFYEARTNPFKLNDQIYEDMVSKCDEFYKESPSKIRIPHDTRL